LRAARHGLERRALAAQHVDGAVDVGRGDFDLRALDARPEMSPIVISG
jgi:hypothetical protein